MSDTDSMLESMIGPGSVIHFSSPYFREDVPLARPADEAQLRELLRYASRDSKKVLPLGFGSKLGWSAPPEHVDFALSTRALTGVVAYEPGDGTLTARAGSTLSDIAAVARTGGNHLTPDVARPSEATLGGVLAAGQSGLDRLRHGPVRHHVLGMRVALADGTIAKSGGRLVKNVTGFDMHRLYCGSHGTLCVIVEASLRLFPGPEHEVSVRGSTKNRADALRAARSIMDAGVNAYSVVVESLHAFPDDVRATPPNNARAAPSEWNVHVLLAGHKEPIDWETDTVAKLLPGSSVEHDARAHARFEELRDLDSSSRGGPSLHIGVLPSELESAIDLVESSARTAGVHAACSIQPSIATMDVHAMTEAQPDSDTSTPERWLALARALRDAKLDARLRNAPPEFMRSFEQGIDLGPGLDWMRRLKRALDPDGVFVAGRVHVGS